MNGESQGADVALAAEGLELAYGETKALTGATIHLRAGEILVLTGKSGSGKSSLLYCMAGILRPDNGRITYGGRDLTEADDDELSQLRRRDFGFVFQFGELVPELTIAENVSLPLRLNRVKRDEARRRTTEMLARLGIAECADKRPGEVSGGQAQRGAIARALVHGPRVVFADEPTGALDSENSKIVLREFVSLARSAASSVVIVTHEPVVAEVGDRHLEVLDGAVHAPNLLQI